jgi:hypothetical protein
MTWESGSRVSHEDVVSYLVCFKTVALTRMKPGIPAFSS